MRRFIGWLLLIYSVITIGIVGGIIFIEKKDQKERYYPRKTLYVINQTNDTLDIILSGSYSDNEKRTLTEKPDSYTLMSESVATPFIWNEAICYAASFRIPHKYDRSIDFPENLTLQIKGSQKCVKINRKRFLSLIENKLNESCWVIYITPEWFENQ